jgi:hypothetical protein
MLQKNGDFIFLTSVISNSCGWQNVAEIAHFSTVARSICRAAFRGMRVHHFFASEIKRQLQANRLGLFVKPHFVFPAVGRMSLPRIGDWPQVILMRHPNSRLVDRGDLPTRYRCTSARYGLSAVAPAQRAVAQRLSAMARPGSAERLQRSPVLGVKRKTYARSDDFAF